MKLFPREKYLKKIRGFYDATDLIKVITGIRRCGKSSIMEMIADELKCNGVADNQIVYLNLDKRGYKSIKTPEALEKTIDSLCDKNTTYYLFIDEIQNVSEFETVLNSYREEGNFSIFITGSNSYLLSGELVTKLTGRYLEFEVFPLTFDEYIQMKKFYKMGVYENLSSEFDKFILDGGFPRSVTLENAEDRRHYTYNVISEIFKKDIASNNKIKYPHVFNKIQTYVINNFGSTISVDNIVNSLKGSGVATTPNTVRKYIGYLVDAKILNECKRFDLKSKTSLKFAQKYYLTDLSIYFSQNTDNRINYGPVLENITYVYARAQGCKVSVGKIGSLECDFIIRNLDLDYSYVQVAMTILSSKQTEDREYNSLEKIKDNYPKYILTRDTLLQKRNGIFHKNIESFMASYSIF